MCYAFCHSLTWYSHGIPKLEEIRSGFVLESHNHLHKEKMRNNTVSPSFLSSIDASEAQSVPGFVCFVSAEDVPGSNITGIANDETVFAKDVVCS